MAQLVNDGPQATLVVTWFTQAIAVIMVCKALNELRYFLPCARELCTESPVFAEQP